MGDFVIRQADSQDAALLSRLNRFVHAGHLAARPAYFRAPDAAELTAWFRAQLQQPNRQAWIVEVVGRAAGYVSTASRSRPANPLSPARDWIEIEHIAVDPTRRRQGLGRALVEQVRRAAADQGVSHIELSSWAFNESAHAFFARCGFQVEVLRFMDSVFLRERG